MTNLRQRKTMFGVLALLALFAACKAETPTSPTIPPNTTTTPTGTTPPTNASITLTVSNANPLIGSKVTVTANVTQNGQAVPNGTAVQFTTNSSTATFTDVTGAGNTIITTTTNGVATATLTNSTAGAVVVTATVNNVTKSTTVTFGGTTPPPPTPNTTPTISGISPSTGQPQGGQILTITGSNFRAPARVVFNCAGTVGAAGATPDPAGCLGQASKDAQVTQVTPTQIQVVTPSFNVPTGKALAFNITVFVAAGTADEQSVVAPVFTFQSPTLTPVVNGVSPTSGPIGGGTRITIFGSGFQAPTQVFFGSAEAQVISVDFNSIIVMSPRASDTSPTGSGTVVGPVDIRVRNINSATEVTFPSGFRYIPKMQITTVNPTQGPITGGTKVTIDGIGFDDPLTVTLGGVVAQVIRVSGTEVVAMTVQPNVITCAGVSGPVTVTNTENGDSASGGSFSFLVPQPVVVSATSPIIPGGTTQVTVLNALGIPRILIGDTPVPITATTANPDGTTTFTVQVPTTIALNTAACPNGSGFNTPQPTPFNVTYTSLTTTCSNTFANGITLIPPNTATLALQPTGFGPFTARFTPAAGANPATETPSAPQTVNIGNTGVAPLTITSVTNTCAGQNFTISAPANGTVLNQCDAVSVTAVYNGPTPPAAGVSNQCQLTITTTAGTRTVTLTGSSQ